MGNHKLAIRPSGWPNKLPCGCLLRNIQGSFIMTHATVMPDGAKHCKCDRRWKLVVKLVEVKTQVALKKKG